MSDTKVNDLIPDILRKIQEEISKIRETQSDHSQRLHRIELTTAGIRKEQAMDAESMAHIEVRFDRIDGRIERIERRLNIGE